MPPCSCAGHYTTQTDVTRSFHSLRISPWSVSVMEILCQLTRKPTKLSCWLVRVIAEFEEVRSGISARCFSALGVAKRPAHAGQAVPSGLRRLQSEGRGCGAVVMFMTVCLGELGASSESYPQ